MLAQSVDLKPALRTCISSYHHGMGNLRFLPCWRSGGPPTQKFLLRSYGI